MSEHYRASEVGETFLYYCGVCRKNTFHRIDRVSVDNPAGKLGPCLEHGPKVNARGENKKQEEARECRERKEEQPGLFDERYEFEERAAIKEFCGNLPREEAEKQALEERKNKP